MNENINACKKMNLECRNSYYLCLHSVSGRTAIPRVCIKDYECYRCTFDQWLDAMEEKEFKSAGAF